MDSPLFLILLVLHHAVVAQRWICLGDVIGSCYMKRISQVAVSFTDAANFCKSNRNSTLAVFPSPQEMVVIHQLITIETKYNANNEQANLPHFYWVGLKFNVSRHSTINNHDLYWVNSHNNITISPDKWKPENQFTLGNPSVRGQGCVAAEIYVPQRPNVETRLKKLTDCGTAAGVKNFICEIRAPTDPDPDRWFYTWQAWNPRVCQTSGQTSASRERICFAHDCELEGLTTQTQSRACCDAPNRNVANGNVIKEYRSTDPRNRALERAVENSTALLQCYRGYVHPVTLIGSHRIRCVRNSSGQGQWDSELPASCIAMNCGDPPLAVHAYPPEYTGTAFNDIAVYFCHPGFKEPKYKESTVTLRCGPSSKWIGLDFDENTKAVCEPLDNVPLQWKYYPDNDHCYQLHHSALSWHEAKNVCTNGLLVLRNQQELTFLKVNIFEPQAERSIIWMAGQKNTSDVQFFWRLENGSNIEVGGYLNWNRGGQPITGVYHQDLCLAANYSEGQWGWLNVSCDSKFEFVCQTLTQKVHGQWSDWTEWSACDRNYVRRRQHVCTNPPPFCGGDNCNGPAEEESNCCVDPGQAPFARIHYRSIDNETVFLLPGHYYTYICDFGYEYRDGSELKNITCQLNGTWTDPGKAPPCSPKRCPPPRNGTHSFVASGLSSSYGHGDGITYDCEEGFVTGKSPSAGIGISTNCSNGTWMHSPLQCYAIRCASVHPQLSDPDYNRRLINKSSVIRHRNTVSHSSWGQATDLFDLYLDKYQYFCQFGYRTSYKTVDYNLTCTQSATWSKMASFEADSHPAMCEPVECPGSPPQAKPNSIWMSGINPATVGFRGTYKQKAQYKCFPGYRVDTGIPGDTRIILNYTFTCDANNDWVDDFSPKQCIKQDCGDPGNGSNVQSRIGKSFLYKASLDYVCKQGYIYNKTISRRHLVCDLHNGSHYASWNGTELLCTKVFCGDPGIGANVTKIGDKYDYGNIVIYECIEQHVLIGGGLEVLWLRCGTGGVWNSSAPSCEPAEIASDFEVIYTKPYASRAQWIMSEKYKGVPVLFKVNYIGKPGYVKDNNSYAYLNDFPDSAVHNDTERVQSAAGGLLSVWIYTRPDYVYEFTLESASSISIEAWPSTKPPLILFTAGGPPFMGSVQKENLPYIIPLQALPSTLKIPTAVRLDSPNSLQVIFDRNMFSEENGTILGFAIVVKEVHPFHLTEAVISKEGYNDRFPHKLYTYRELESFTKYLIWPAYFSSPLCNPFGNNNTCQDIIGESPSDSVTYVNSNSIDSAKWMWTTSIYSEVNGDDDLGVSFTIGSDTSCDKYDKSLVCNGPLRKNRKFCIKLRAYNRYGWNDSFCSNVIILKKVLEFDHALVVPTVLAALPFTIFAAIGIYLCVKDKGNENENEDDEAEGEIIKTWSLHHSSSFPETEEFTAARHSLNRAKARRRKSSAMGDHDISKLGRFGGVSRSTMRANN